MRALAITAIVAIAVTSACSEGKKKRKGDLLVEDDRRAPVATIGVSPLDFECDSVAKLEAIEAIVGRPIEQVASGFAPPAGVPKPCHYVSTVEQEPGEWSFDIDCRERAIDDGNRLMTQYATEAGSVPVRVGRSGIDHHNVQLLFFDDDAPCYVRVNAAKEEERLALAQLIADGLTRRNAPGKVSFVEVTTSDMKVE